MEVKKFNALYIRTEDKNAGYIEIPFDVEKEYGAKRVKILALLDGIKYRGSLVRMGTDCHILGIPKVIREKINKNFGDVISVELSLDSDKRVVLLPEDFKIELFKNKKVLQFFELLSYTNQKKYITWIESSKKDTTRIDRINKSIELLNINKTL